MAWRCAAIRLELPCRLHRPRHPRAPRRTALGTLGEDLGSGIELGFYRLLSAGGGFTLDAPDKTINYSKTPQSARYAFTFWAFPRADYVKNLKDYVKWADDYYKQHGFRCNMPLGSYFIRKDTSSLLSYTCDGDIISLDPIHAPGEREPDLGRRSCRRSTSGRTSAAAFRCSIRARSSKGARRGGVRRSLEEAGRLARTVDPDRRMVNEFFSGLLV